VTSAANARPAVSLRRSLLLLLLGALAYVAVVGLVLVVRITPATERLTRESEGVVYEFENSEQRIVRLDVVHREVIAQLDSATRGHASLEALGELREQLERMEESAHTLERLSAPSGERSRLRDTLVQGVLHESALRSALLGAAAAIEIADLPAAARLLRNAENAARPVHANLNNATTIALDDVRREEDALADTASNSATLVIVWFAAGALFFPMIVLFLRRRLDAPLAEMDHALTRVTAGDFDVDLQAPVNDEIGRLAQHFNRMVDVLRQRASEEQERSALESARRTRAILDAALDAVVVIDEQGAIREWSPQAETTFGWRRDEVIGKSVADVIYPEEARGDLARGLKRFGEGAATPMLGRRVETTAVRRDGTRIPVELAITPLHHAGHTEFSAFIRDVGEQRRLEMELRHAQKMEAVGQLAGGIAHDFNNLLTGIIGYADLMQRDDQASPQQREDAAAIMATAQRGAELARGMLTMARRSHGKREAVDVDRVTQEVVDLFSRTMDRRIELAVQLRAAAQVRGDRSQLSNAILNLALNARDAMPDGGRLTIGSRIDQLDAAFCASHSNEATAGDYLALTVSDTGIGMSDDVRARIFEPFFTTKAAGEGTGLGLAMVYGTVQAHRGMVTVESSPGLGTTFTLYLPVEGADKEEDSGPTRDVRKGRGRVLIVDDEDGVRKVAQRLLTKMGYTVETARDGQEAVDLIREDPRRCDLVLLDNNMPRMTGRDAAKIIRDIRPDLPLVLATGYFEAYVDAASTFGVFNGAIAKPYDLSTLSKTIAAHLKHLA